MEKTTGAPESQVAKRGFTIKEAREIYGLTVDTLYYYEQKGLISPRRDESNGYRLFGVEDFYRLNVITELRAMGFELDQIRAYFDTHTLETSMQLLSDELASIDDAITRLENLKGSVVSSIKRYTSAMSLALAESIVITQVPERRCLLVAEGIVNYDDIPYLFAKRAGSLRTSMGMMHSTPCYVVDPSEVHESGAFMPKAILLYSEQAHLQDGYRLAAGAYASCTFKGTMAAAPAAYRRILAYLGTRGFEPCGDPVEFCLIGEYESDNADEYVNRIEVPVRPRKG